MKINYRTAYDATNRICGYVIARDKGNYFVITERQYNRALSNRTIGGVAGIIFDTDDDKPVRVVDKYGIYIS